MKKNHRFWLLALALSLLLTCAACGKKTVSYAPGNIPTATQEQTTDTRKNDTAETGTTKADGKQDAAKTEDKTADDKIPAPAEAQRLPMREAVDYPAFSPPCLQELWPVV